MRKSYGESRLLIVGYGIPPTMLNAIARRTSEDKCGWI